MTRGLSEVGEREGHWTTSSVDPPWTPVTHTQEPGGPSGKSDKGVSTWFSVWVPSSRSHYSGDVEEAVRLQEGGGSETLRTTRTLRMRFRDARRDPRAPVGTTRGPFLRTGGEGGGGATDPKRRRVLTRTHACAQDTCACVFTRAPVTHHDTRVSRADTRLPHKDLWSTFTCSHTYDRVHTRVRVCTLAIIYRVYTRVYPPSLLPVYGWS